MDFLKFEPECLELFDVHCFNIYTWLRNFLSVVCADIFCREISRLLARQCTILEVYLQGCFDPTSVPRNLHIHALSINGIIVTCIAAGVEVWIHNCA